MSAGVVLLLVVTVADGGTFVLRGVTTGQQPANELQRSFFRAGHAHAAVLISLGLLVLVLVLVSSPGVPGWSRTGARRRLLVLLWVGAGVLTLGLVSAGVGLVIAGTSSGPQNLSSGMSTQPAT